MYDNEQLYLRPEVARALGYRVPDPLPTRVPLPRIHAVQPHEGLGFFSALFGIFAAGFVLILLGVGLLAVLGYLTEQTAATVQPPKRTVAIARNENLPRRIIESRPVAAPAEIPDPNAPTVVPQYAVSVRVQQSQESQKVIEVPQLPAAADTGAAEGPLYTEQTDQGPLSWQWVCSTPQPGNFRCSLRDQNGNYLQTFAFDGNGLAPSYTSPGALRPQSWGCERTVDEKLYCTIQDDRGTILQGCIYDGKTLGCGTVSSNIPAEVSDEEPVEPEYLPTAYDIGCLKGLPFGSILVYEHIPRWAVYGNVDRIPEGTCLLVERANINGYRRVVSFDGRYAGYAQIWASAGNPQTRKPMQPGYEELIARLRRIP
jgi:hypothetical protein